MNFKNSRSKLEIFIIVIIIKIIIILILIVENQIKGLLEEQKQAKLENENVKNGHSIKIVRLLKHFRRGTRSMKMTSKLR